MLPRLRLRLGDTEKIDPYARPSRRVKMLSIIGVSSD